MEIHAVCDKYIIFSMPSDDHPDINNTEILVRQILDQNSLPQWRKLCIDVFTSEKLYLYLAYPETKVKINIAPYAIPFLEEYFTE